MVEPILQTKALTKSFDSFKAVDKVNLHMHKGRIYGLFGQNGAGKTTIMKMILGLAHITSGEVFVFGQSLAQNKKAIYSRMDCTIETPGFYPNMTAYENLLVLSRLKGSSKNSIKKALDTVELPNNNKMFSKFSLGMKQRLGIAAAILNDPDILILDEPTNGLDPMGIADVRNFIKTLCKEHGKTVLISSHQLSEIQNLADDIGILHNGVLVEECQMADMIKLNEKYIQIEGPESGPATELLEQKLEIKNIKVIDSKTIQITDTKIPPSKINRVLIESGMDVSGLYAKSMNLEEYFSGVIGKRK